ncbi:class I SAM-dependent methyltransferase [Pseudochryseolinea flava]|uniref:Methyltransferase domain-containing protein n=1 Tax=Pseudochryseolinea flava TaxID=2059302 RepID=A0A364Y6L7_9BACT|nr:methyltransferase domain-containing protein [Pseudochryseolinea flava]RAW02746.1 hypothetical protein DQQ10_01160 [Pseudochryseolinea flava]
MSIQSFLANHPDFYREGLLFFQRRLARESDFEKAYITLREKEGRVYSDDVVKALPVYRGGAMLEKEWKIRKRSADKLIGYLKKKPFNSILEVGCGNGWLLNYINQSMKIGLLGIDINETELRQAASLFSPNISFACADVDSDLPSSLRADVILLPSALQYFENPIKLITTLITKLNPNGELHVFDSPLYNANEVDAAQSRSKEYFTKQRVEPMKGMYYHHAWNILECFEHVIMHDPRSIRNRVFAKVGTVSPFPWIKIKAK